MHELSFITALSMGSYTAMVAFYQAHGKHSHLTAIKYRPILRKLLIACGLLLLFFTVLFSGIAWGWEYGVPISLGIFNLVGLINIFISERLSRMHIRTGIAAFFFMLFSYGVSLT